MPYSNPSDKRISVLSHICTSCGHITSIWFMCARDEHNPPYELCHVCFEKTPCGKGEHGEDCRTSVFNGE